MWSFSSCVSSQRVLVSGDICASSGVFAVSKERVTVRDMSRSSVLIESVTSRDGAGSKSRDFDPTLTTLVLTASSDGIVKCVTVTIFLTWDKVGRRTSSQPVRLVYCEIKCNIFASSEDDSCAGRCVSFFIRGRVFTAANIVFFSSRFHRSRTKFQYVVFRPLYVALAVLFQADYVISFFIHRKDIHPFCVVLTVESDWHLVSNKDLVVSDHLLFTELLIQFDLDTVI